MRISFMHSLIFFEAVPAKSGASSLYISFPSKVAARSSMSTRVSKRFFLLLRLVKRQVWGVHINWIKPKINLVGRKNDYRFIAYSGFRSSAMSNSKGLSRGGRGRGLYIYLFFFWMSLGKLGNLSLNSKPWLVPGQKIVYILCKRLLLLFPKGSMNCWRIPYLFFLSLKMNSS